MLFLDTQKSRKKFLENLSHGSASRYAVHFNNRHNRVTKTVLKHGTFFRRAKRLFKSLSVGISTLPLEWILCKLNNY